MKQLNLVFFFLLFTITVFAQEKCDFELKKEELSTALGGYQYEKTLRVDGKSGRLQYLEYTIVMKKGESYRFNIQTPNGGADGIIMKVYDRRTKDRVLTNFSSSGIKSDFTYTCTKTGIYDIRFSFKGSKNYCGICVCGSKAGGA